MATEISENLLEFFFIKWNTAVVGPNKNSELQKIMRGLMHPSHEMHFWESKLQKNMFAAEALPRTTLRHLTALSQIP